MGTIGSTCLRAGTLWCLALLCADGVAGASVRGGTLTIALDQEPPTLDPHASPSAATFAVVGNVVENLLYQAPGGAMKPWLAESYAVSADGKAFTFRLRNDAAFSDGTPVDAAAVKWNLDRIVDPGFKAGVALTALEGYGGSTVIDAHTLRVQFRTASAPFLTYLASEWLAMLSPQAAAAPGGAVNQRPVGSGPFIVTEYVPKDRLVFSRSTRYGRRAPWSDHSGPPYLETVIWRFIPEAGTRRVTVQSGETQMVIYGSMPAAFLRAFAGDRALRVEQTPYPGLARLWAMNVRLAPTDDLQVRQALEYGINRAAFADSIYSGLGSVACAPLTQYALAVAELCHRYAYDPRKAAQLLDAAGWRVGADNVRRKNGKPLTLLINSLNYGGGDAPEVELLQGQLLGLGFDARIKSQARPPFYEDNYHCTTNGPIMFLRDPDWNALDAVFGSANIGGNFNWSCYANPQVDALLQSGRAESNPARRRAVYGRIERILMDQAVAVPLVDERSVWVVRATVNDLRYTYSAYPLLGDAYVTR